MRKAKKLKSKKKREGIQKKRKARLSQKEVRIRAAYKRLQSEADICDRWRNGECVTLGNEPCLIMENKMCSYYARIIPYHCGCYKKVSDGCPKDDIQLIQVLEQHDN